MPNGSSVSNQIVLPEITQSELDEFDLTTRHGRDAIAQVIQREVDEYCRQYFDESRRQYLGASGIGHECNLYLWRTFRWQKQEKFNGRMLRLFNTGHREEEMFLKYLRGIGFVINEIDPNTEKQYRAYFAERHGSGSCDGIGTGFPERYQLPQVTKLLLEFKTSNGKLFEKIENTGVQDAKPQHWSQICTYGYTFDIDYVLYLAKNKDTDKIYFEIEEIDKRFGKQEVDKANDIIFQMYPPAKIAANSMTPPCKWCFYNGICFKGEQPEKNCRSCQHASPIANGEWQCGLYSQTIPTDFIPKGCDKWRSL